MPLCRIGHSFVLFGLCLSSSSRVGAVADEGARTHNLRRRTAYGFDCGCGSSCTEQVLDTYATKNGESHTCGNRIKYLKETKGYTWDGACFMVSGLEFPDICGPACDPLRCNVATSPSPPPPQPEPTHCGCNDCTDEIWDTMASGHSCGSRIEWLKTPSGGSYSDLAACLHISNSQYEHDTVCGPYCDPTRCDQQSVSSPNPPPPPPSGSPLSEPSSQPSTTPSVSPSNETPPSDSPSSVPSTSPSASPSNDPPPSDSPSLGPSAGPSATPSRQLSSSETMCGCNSCTENVLNANAANLTCKARIEWLMGGQSEDRACAQVGQVEFPNECGGCNPYRCDGRTEQYYYCFPPAQSRVKHSGVWGKYNVEVKEGYCDPGGNHFSANSVSVTTDNKLNLSFKKVGPNWEGSEVRIPAPADPFTYGTYSFTVKSILVTDKDGNFKSNILPEDLVLGMFTWDPVDEYKGNQNWNKEVDVEIIRWGDPTIEDVLFLVQPPGDPQSHRFYSGTTPGTYNHQDQTYSFTWLPGHLSWNSTAGGGGGQQTNTHVYTTESAVKEGREDLVQCLPANVEIRINLWKRNGIDNPMGLLDTDRVDVVMDDFTFSKSNAEYVDIGGYCSKDCQCASSCVDGICAGPHAVSNTTTTTTTTTTSSTTTNTTTPTSTTTTTTTIASTTTNGTTTTPPSPSPCGCDSCTQAALNTLAGTVTCGDRIAWLQTWEGGSYSELDACSLVNGPNEHPNDCAPCDPGRCHGISAPQSNNTMFGPNTFVFDTSMSINEIKVIADTLWELQRNNEMGTERYSLLFRPGIYGTPTNPLQIKVGYYTEVAGLGLIPSDVQIHGKIEVYNRCFEPKPYDEGFFIPTDDTKNGLCFALNNFWRSLSNLKIIVNNKGQEKSLCGVERNFWAVSQASSMRRVDIDGELTLMDYCSSPGFGSGGYIADTRVNEVVVNGGQQQYYARNSQFLGWSNAIWNQMFTGVIGAPPTNTKTHDPAYTTLSKTPISREKPFLFIDSQGSYNVRIPNARFETSGTSWSTGQLTSGRTIPLSDFFVVNPNRTVPEMNAKLSSGKHLLFIPGVYNIDQTIHITNPNTVIMGMGLATLTAVNGSVPLKIANEVGIIIAGLTVDAGPTVVSPVLVQVGPPASTSLPPPPDKTNPITLIDLYIRVGGPHIGKTNIGLEINSHDVLIDHTWIWRADHGIEGLNTTDGFNGDNERWKTVIGTNGLVVNGNDVTVTGLFVEHFQEHNVVWNGERGRVYFFQNELPYEPLTQSDWIKSDGTLGWSGYKVHDSVTTHELWGGGVYCYNRNNPNVTTENGFEVPNATGVVLNRVMTKNLSGPGKINHVVNGVGDTVDGPDEFEAASYVLSYPVLTTPVTAQKNSSFCQDHGVCANLKLTGECCPTTTGVRLACCDPP